MVKVLFLDIDGVMNNVDVLNEGVEFDVIGEDKLVFLKSIIEQTEAKIILSSSWRLSDKLKKKAKLELQRFGMEILDATGDEQYPRCNEIKEWLDCNEVDKFAILDDSGDAGTGFEHSFFQTTFKEGLTESISKMVIEHLN